MKAFLTSGFLLLLAVSAVPAQDRSQLYSQPLPPPRDALDRLNLVMAWRTYIPTGGRRDGLVNVQRNGRDLFVQTRAGLVVMLDPETGETRWRARVGNPYQTARGLAFNSRTVFAINSTYLYALDRNSGGVQWRFRLPGGSSAPPIADDDFLFLASATGNLTAYVLPRPDRPSKTEPAMVSPLYQPNQRGTAVGPLESTTEFNREVPIGPQPVQVWDSLTRLRLELAPVQSPDFILHLSPSGVALGVYKAFQPDIPSNEKFRFDMDSPALVAPGHFGDTAFLGAQDGNVYALDIPTGRLLWRYTTGSPIRRRPAALEEDVYITSERNGLARIDRATGEARWSVLRGARILNANPDAERFLAANPKFVYALDTSGRLLVLDRAHGTRLSVYDVRDFVVPVVNETTDRLYLAANNGMIVCLHDKEYTTPYSQRKSEEEALDPMRQKLAQLVTNLGGKPVPLRDMIEKLKTDFNLKFLIVERAFKDAGWMEPVAGKPVTFPKVDNKPLGEVLAKILEPINARFEVQEGIILILPAKKKE
jgi:outer membrane protein assembly factor BamB